MAKLNDELENICQWVWTQEAHREGRDLDIEKLSDIKIFKAIEKDVDQDGEDEVCFVAGTCHPWDLMGKCVLVDPTPSGIQVAVLCTSLDGFRNLDISDLNKDGIQEIILTSQSGSGGFLELKIWQWDGKEVRRIFPDTPFYQGYFELKDLDADGIDEIVVWQGEWTEPFSWEPQSRKFNFPPNLEEVFFNWKGPSRWDPKKFEIFIFRFNSTNSSYELIDTKETSRKYYPRDVLKRIYGGLIGQPLEAGMRSNSVNELREKFENSKLNREIDNKLVHELMEQQDFLKREGYHSEAIEVSKIASEAMNYVPDTTENRIIKIDLYRNMGIVFSQLGKFHEAINCYSNSLAQWEKGVDASVQNRFRAGCFRELGMMYTMLGNYENALPKLEQARLILESLDQTEKENRAEKSRLFSNFGLTHMGLSNYSEAVSAFEKARTLDEELGNSFGLAINYMGWGNCKRIQREYNSAIEAYQLALASLDEVSERDREADIYLELGITLILDQQIFPGLDCLHKALLLTSLDNLSWHGGIYYTYLGQGYLQSGDLQKSKAYFTKAVHLSEEFGTPETKWQSLLGLGKLEAHNLNQTESIEKFREAVEVIEEMRSQYLPESLKISLLSNKNIAYEFTILALKDVDKILAFDYLERAKSRVFVEQLSITNFSNIQGIPSNFLKRESELIEELRRLQLQYRKTFLEAKYTWGDEINNLEKELKSLWEEIHQTGSRGAEYINLRNSSTVVFEGLKFLLASG